MKTFEDLVFEPWGTRGGPVSEELSKYGFDRATQAVMDFDNGYGVSVLFGSAFYSDGVETYEVGIRKDGNLSDDNPFCEDILGYQTKDEVTEIMKALQEYGKES